MSGRRSISVLLLLGSLTGSLIALPQLPQLVMDTQGYISFIDHIHGQARTSDPDAGYRLEFLGLTDFIRWNDLYISGLVSNKTVIRGELSRGEFSLIKLMFNMRPDIRYEFPGAILRAGINHESNHSVSVANPDLYIWMNSYQLSLGSKGSSYLFIRDEFKAYRDQFINQLDGMIYLAKFRTPGGTIWTGKNHDYKWKVGGRVRFQVGSFRNWAFFVGTDASAWVRESGAWEQQTVVRLNMFRKHLHNFAGIYYAYHIRDTYRFDNESYLGSLGLQVIF